MPAKPAQLVIIIDNWNSGPDDFADFMRHIIRHALPQSSARITVKVVKD